MPPQVEPLSQRVVEPQVHPNQQGIGVVDEIQRGDRNDSARGDRRGASVSNHASGSVNGNGERVGGMALPEGQQMVVILYGRDPLIADPHTDGFVSECLLQCQQISTDVL
jgi:hypothetical protein